MQTKVQLIQRFNHAREEVRALLPDVDRLMEIYPGWTIKEVLSHLVGWDDATILALQNFAASSPPLMTAMRGIDYYNSQTVAERKELDYDQIVREWEWVRGQLMPILEQLTQENLATTIVTPWGSSMQIEDMINIMIDHEKEHAEVIRERIAHPDHPPQAH
jgi:hypothetical protein